MTTAGIESNTGVPLVGTGRTTLAPWAIVLAGGEGRRLRTLTRHVCGDDRPKQFAVLVGGRSLLRQTLDRIRVAIPVERTVVVTHARDAAYLAGEFAAEAKPDCLVQPEDRGTAAAILWAAHTIAAREPGAVAVVVPCDHHIEGEAAFMTHVLDVVTFVRGCPSAAVLSWARCPTGPIRSTGGSSQRRPSAGFGGAWSGESDGSGRSQTPNGRERASRRAHSGTPSCWSPGPRLWPRWGVRRCPSSARGSSVSPPSRARPTRPGRRARRSSWPVTPTSRARCWSAPGPPGGVRAAGRRPVDGLGHPGACDRHTATAGAPTWMAGGTPASFRSPLRRPRGGGAAP